MTSLITHLQGDQSFIKEYQECVNGVGSTAQAQRRAVVSKYEKKYVDRYTSLEEKLKVTKYFDDLFGLCPYGLQKEKQMAAPEDIVSLDTIFNSLLFDATFVCALKATIDNEWPVKEQISYIFSAIQSRGYHGRTRTEVENLLIDFRRMFKEDSRDSRNQSVEKDKQWKFPNTGRYLQKEEIMDTAGPQDAKSVGFSHPTVEAITNIRGRDARHYSDNQILDIIRELEKEIGSLENIIVKSTKVEAMIKGKQEDIAALVKILDARP